MVDQRTAWIKDILPPFLTRGLAAARRRLRQALGRPAPDTAGQVRPAQWYDQSYAGSEIYRRHYTRSPDYFMWCVAADRIKRRGVRRLVDLGCGPGQTAALLRQYLEQADFSYLGLDFSAQAVALARQAGLEVRGPGLAEREPGLAEREPGPGFAFEGIDLGRPGVLAAYEYDALLALEFLEHVPFDLELLRQAPAGTWVLASVPNFPYPSHVRHFADAAAVRRRYGELFDEFRVDELRADEEGHCFFMFEGVRKWQVVDDNSGK